MNNLTLCKCGKPNHGEYPLCDEPDREEFAWAEMPCLLLRHTSAGHWCGYVGLHRGHPLYQKSYDDIDVEVHGGLTFGMDGDGDKWPTGYWWVGFDCAHVGDVSPFWARAYSSAFGDGVYRTIGYARHETQRLAEQLARLAWELHPENVDAKP